MARRAGLPLCLVLVLGETGLVPRATAVARPDIYYIWRDGVRLAEGENPYSYDRPPDLDESLTKHPSYLPLFYLAVAGVHQLGLREYQTWLHVWRAVRIVTHITIAVLLYLTAAGGYPLLGLFGALFWSFNRWTLYTVRSGGLDELALLFLLLSLQWFMHRPRAAFLLFGTSLAIKQVGLLVAPLYLVWTWHQSPGAPMRDRWMAVGRAALWIALVPVGRVSTLPMVGPERLCSVIAARCDRPPDGYAHVSAVGSLAGLRGARPRFRCAPADPDRASRRPSSGSRSIHGGLPRVCRVHGLQHRAFPAILRVGHPLHRLGGGGTRTDSVMAVSVPDSRRWSWPPLPPSSGTGARPER